MRRLMLLRHAKTEQDSPSGRDYDRALDERGRKDADEMGGYLAQHGLAPDLALVSPAVRARETWERMLTGLNPSPPADMVPGLYGADVSVLLQIAAQASGRSADKDLKGMMIVAHNPGLHEFAFALIAKAKDEDHEALHDNLPTSGLAVIDLPIDDWSDLSLRTGKLVRFVSPRLLREQRDG